MMENNKLSNLDLDLVNREREISSIINADNILEKNCEKEFEDIVNVDEVNLDSYSERSIISKQDVLDMISENNNIINAKFDNVKIELDNIKMDVKMDINDLRSDMLEMNKNNMWELKNMFDTMMAKFSSTAVQKVSDDHPMSDYIGGFIKDPNLIDTNVKQLVEDTVNSKVGEFAEMSGTMDDEEIDIVFIRCEDVETSDQYKSSTDVATDTDTLIQEFSDMEVNLLQLCNITSHALEDSILGVISDDDTDKVLDDMVISDDNTDEDMDISDAYKVKVISYYYALESYSGNTNDFHIVEIADISSLMVPNGLGQLAHPVMRFVNQRRVFDPGGITP